MTDIRHRIGVESASTDDVFAALTTIDGLSGWWTPTRQVTQTLGGKLAFRFPPGGFDMEVLEVVPAERVRWRVVDGPPEWIDTTIDFRLSRADRHTIVLFSHEGWAEPVEFLHHCSTKWAMYLMSLKELVETGQGRPSPDDVRICEWD